ncbi:MAG: RimK family alpha-L-glutamate ligase [Clostridia bacterium]|nr:RimK family alpha-L-glutamate ligase [Clostridia bacterium]
MMQGLIIINAYPNGEKFIRQGDRIAQELHALGTPTDVLRNGEIYASICDGEVEIQLPKKYDFIVYLDKDKYLGKALEQKGFRLFNSASAIEVCDDKVLTYFALKNAGVRAAKTIPAPLCYTPNATANEAFLQKVTEELSFPLVVKKSYGSFGAGVRLAKDFSELKTVANDFLHEPHCYQQFLVESAGKDIRVIVIGGKAVAAMERVAKAGEFRSNIELGGKGKRIDLTKAYAETAEKAAKALGLDYCGVDLLATAQGAVVCEVNSNAFFEGLEKTTGVNVAKKYTEYILSVLS